MLQKNQDTFERYQVTDILTDYKSFYFKLEKSIAHSFKTCQAKKFELKEVLLNDID